MKQCPFPCAIQVRMVNRHIQAWHEFCSEIQCHCFISLGGCFQVERQIGLVLFGFLFVIFGEPYLDKGTLILGS